MEQELLKTFFNKQNLKTFTKCSYQFSKFKDFDLSTLRSNVTKNKGIIDVFDTVFFKGTKTERKSDEYKSYWIMYIQLFCALIKTEDIIKLLKISNININDFPEMKKSNITDIEDFILGFIQFVKRNTNIVNVQFGGEDDDDIIEYNTQFDIAQQRKLSCGTSLLLLFLGIIGMFLSSQQMFNTIIEDSADISDRIIGEIQTYTQKTVSDSNFNKIIKKCVSQEKCGMNELSMKELMKLYDSNTDKMEELEDMDILYDVDAGATFEEIAMMEMDEKEKETIREKEDKINELEKKRQALLSIKKFDMARIMEESQSRYMREIDDIKRKSLDYKPSTKSKVDTVDPRVKDIITSKFQPGSQEISLSFGDYYDSMLYIVGYRTDIPIIEEVSQYHLKALKSALPSIIELLGDSIEKATTRTIRRSESGGSFAMRTVSNILGLVGIKTYEPETTTEIISKGIDTFQQELTFHTNKLFQIVRENMQDGSRSISSKISFYGNLMLASLVVVLFSLMSAIYVSNVPIKVKNVLLNVLGIASMQLNRGVVLNLLRLKDYITRANRGPSNVIGGKSRKGNRYNKKRKTLKRIKRVKKYRKSNKKHKKRKHKKHLTRRR